MSGITATPTSQRIAAVVRSHFAMRNLHKQDLVPIIERSWPTASRRINGKSDWPIDDIEKVARFLGMSPQRLFDLAADLEEDPAADDEVEHTLPVDPFAQPARAGKRGA